MESQELHDVFNGLIETHKLKIYINEWAPAISDGPTSLDIEHDEQGNLVGIGWYDGVYSQYWTTITHMVKRHIESMQIIAHNGRADFDCLRNWGIDVQDNQLFHDTELMAHIIDSSRHSYGLKSLAEADLGIVYPSYDDIVGKRTKKQSKPRKTLDQWPVDLVAKYNALDCFATYKLYEQQVSMLRSGCEASVAQKYFKEIERPVALILQDMENRGVCVDLNYLELLKMDLERQQKPIRELILNELGQINLNSPRQLLEALNAKEIYPTFKGKASTDKRALNNIKNSKIIENLKQFSEIETLLTSFVRPYLERKESIVHPWFNQCGTRTGRLSCSNPNLLQIPRKTENGKLVRRMFVPRPGMVMGSCDFGQIEPRIMAHLSKDPVLCKMFNDGVDFHQFTADKLSISRDRAKVLNLSVGYKATKWSVQHQLGGSLEEAQKEIDKWWALFPHLRRWQDRLLYDSKRSGFCTTLFGRRIRIDELGNENPWRWEAAERQVINNIVQGSAAEVMKLAMIEIDKNKQVFRSDFGLLVQIYDELLFESSEIKRDLALIEELMMNCVKLNVPLTVNSGYGDNWDACKS